MVKSKGRCPLSSYKRKTKPWAALHTAYEHYRQDVVASAKVCVEEGGGIWVGIQECEGMLYDLALFNSKKTGSTLALKTTEVTPELVRDKIRRSDAAFARSK